MDVVAQGRKRAQARRDAVVRAGLLRDPVLFRDAVAVEPEDEALLDLAPAGRRIGGTALVEHGVQSG